MSPLASWGLIFLLVGLGGIAALMIADWVDAGEDRRWERDADRWQRAREELDR